MWALVSGVAAAAEMLDCVVAAAAVVDWNMLGRLSAPNGDEVA